ncbi:MAG: universal stress protein, partial [Vicinamibacteria bacterium]
MYKKIYVPVDNSDYSNAAAELAISLGKRFGAKLVGCHVYAAKMHDYRFKQMEYTLPDEYIDEVELERQRKIHDSLITMGLQLISDSYLDVLSRRCGEESIAFERKMLDGKHHRELIRDVQESDYDLVVIGALGMGAVKDSLIGSVCERTVRRTTTDTHVVKDLSILNRAAGETEAARPILVGIDGSPQSFAALRTALALGRAFGRAVKAVAVYDPYLHYAMFNSIIDVLSEKASKVFRFKEQEQLHEEIIDTGLAKIYQSHLEIAREIAKEDGVDLDATLLDGKAFDRMLRIVRNEKPWLLVLGRIGVHSPEGETEMGSNAENLLRLAPCNILLTNRRFVPPLDVRAEEVITWTDEAIARMERAPSLVRGIARTAVLRFAIEQGNSVITSKVIDQAMSAFMPGGTQRAMGRAATELAIERVRDEETL